MQRLLQNGALSYPGYLSASLAGIMRETATEHQTFLAPTQYSTVGTCCYVMDGYTEVAQPNTRYISTHLVGIMRCIKHSEIAKENGNNSRKTRTLNVRGTCIVQEL